MATTTALPDAPALEAPETAAAVPPGEPAEATPAPPKKRNPLVLAVLALAVLVGGYFGWQHYQFGRAHESTDDAQVTGDLYPVLPRVGGPVLKVLVGDNQPVRAGQVLVTLDPAEFQQRLQAAEAALEAAQAQVTAARAAVGTAQASVQAAQTNTGVSEATRVRLQKDIQRSQLLRRKDIIPASELDAVQANLRATTAQQATAQDQVAVARRQVAEAQQKVTVAQAQAKQRQADLANARLQLSYTSITAPAAGIVSQKSVQPGQVVGPGQQLFSLVDPARTWVVANFKETQLKQMRVGQAAQLEVDAYPGEEFAGHIESLAAATGSSFALLPPDNASGNFVKVTQRVPVKIVLDRADPQHPLRAGMSVNAVVTVGE